MKTKIYILLYTLIWFFSVPCVAQRQVTKDDAINIATSYIQRDARRSIEIAKHSFYSEQTHTQDTLFYDIVFNDSIEVLVSGNQSCRPILGYFINKSGIPILQDTTNIPDGLKFMLSEYRKQLEYGFLHNLPIHPEWQSINGKALSDWNVVVGPLLSTKWGQSESNDDIDNMAYNYYVPTESCQAGHHCPAGCVAVAMGQIMKYWNYPVYLQNRSDQFDWCNMRDSLITTSANYEKERNAIAYLLWQCGLAVDMDYCSDEPCEASSSSNSSIDDALIDVFNYSSDADYKTKAMHLSEWTNLIKSDLDNGWPVIYGGLHLGGGHSFVCEGYTSDNMFLFNWGWCGNYDGAFSLDALNIDPDHTYNLFQDAVFHIHPNASVSVSHCDFTLPLWVHYYSYYTVYQNTNPAPYYNIPKTATNLTSVPESFQASWRTIPTGTTTSYEAHNSVTLVPGFHAERGSNFSVRISSCKECEESRQESPAYSKGAIQYSNPTSSYITDCNINEDQKIKVYPNPTDGFYR